MDLSGTAVAEVPKIPLGMLCIYNVYNDVRRCSIDEPTGGAIWLIVVAELRTISMPGKGVSIWSAVWKESKTDE